MSKRHVFVLSMRLIWNASMTLKELDLEEIDLLAMIKCGEENKRHLTLIFLSLIVKKRAALRDID